MRVLHVDDVPVVLRATKRLMSKTYPEVVVVAANGPIDGHELLAESGFDVVLCDIDMPGQDGIAFMHEVHQTRPALPFVFLTGQKDEVEALLPGVTVLDKSAPISEIYEALRKAIAP